LAAGGEVSVNPDGVYESVCREHGLPTHPLLGSWRALPYLYQDSVLQEAEQILKDASGLAAKDAEAKARVQFLRDGLRFFRATRDLMAIANQNPRIGTEGHKEMKRRISELRALNLELSPRHVVWGDVVLGALSRRILKDDAAKAALDMRGL
jgi:hypothetical protein